MHNYRGSAKCSLIGGVACTFDLNMIPEAIGKKLEPMEAEECEKLTNYHSLGNFRIKKYACKMFVLKNYRTLR